MQYNKLTDKKTLDETVSALKKHGYDIDIVKNGQEALEKIKQSIPENASVMNGSSTTLAQIGFVDYLKSGVHKWNNLHASIIAEKDPIKQAQLRRQAILSDYYLGSVHALAKNGEFIIASNSGSQLPYIVYTSPNLIFVVSTKKIVASLDDGIKRLEQHVIPLEDKRMMSVYKMHTNPRKILMFKSESPMGGRKIKFILVEQDLGF